MPPRGKRLAVKDGLKDYIIVLTIGYLIAIKHTFFFFFLFDIECLYLKRYFFTVRKTVLLSSMQHTVSTSTG